MTTSSSHLLKAAFLLNKLTRFLISGVIEVPLLIPFRFDRPRRRSTGSKSALPKRNIGAGLDASIDEKSDRNDEKLRGSVDVAGALLIFLETAGAGYEGERGSAVGMPDSSGDIVV